ncbi:patatin family protein [Heterostelium album PN500]|uniref:Patatin family protein n=1 Tax=Heterostelium pallidum (strain ATCC 26659 / Pp 5 / PN500) TaxID=670386 RepID=D3BGT5_HETP5|nr:patatin family protein [Heterostelium album PN500]EFA79319.1 patatin family protein [Heterostelium album PN500]|eukprot:XP_020431440.1 patatin family protein [Heterostelium album PN500]
MSKNNKEEISKDKVGDDNEYNSDTDTDDEVTYFVDDLDTVKLVVSCDGGGMRGLIALQILEYIQEVCGVDIIHRADLLGGTSTGALLAFTKSNGYSDDEITDTYKKMGVIMFDGFFKKFINVLRDFCLSDMRAYEKELDRLFSQVKMSDFLQERKLFVLSSARNREQQTYIPKVISNYKPTSATVIQALRATSSAPPYFSPVEIEGVTYVDGGILANNPIFKAKEESDRLFRPGTKLIMVSIGTGHVKNQEKSTTPEMFSEGALSPALVRTLLSAIANSHSLHKDFKDSVHNNPMVSYHRFDVVLEDEIKLDDHSEKAIQTMARTVQTFKEHTKIQKKLQKLKEDLQSLPTKPAKPTKKSSSPPKSSKPTAVPQLHPQA